MNWSISSIRTTPRPFYDCLADFVPDWKARRDV